MLRDEELELTDSTSGGDDNYDGDDFDGVQHGQNTGQEQTFHNPAFNNGAGNGNTVAAATASRGQPQLQEGSSSSSSSSSSSNLCTNRMFRHSRNSTTKSCGSTGNNGSSKRGNGGCSRCIWSSRCGRNSSDWETC